MTAGPNYVPLANPYRGFNVLVFVREEAEKQVGQAVILNAAHLQLMTIDRSEYIDFDIAYADVLARSKKWIDEHLQAASDSSAH